MAQVRRTVALSDKEIRNALIEKAKEAVNGKPNGPNITGTVKVEISSEGKEVSAVVHFEQPGATR